MLKTTFVSPYNNEKFISIKPFNVRRKDTNTSRALFGAILYARLILHLLCMRRTLPISIKTFHKQFVLYWFCAIRLLCLRLSLMYSTFIVNSSYHGKRATHSNCST
ncbi:hypothetical protein GYMLUDRAFT_571067 [Collybiopsis luxurians FD-317 M1]|uniref:Uncharacterized protein n=1 Tax=Collybiopsis luxurians FD-317 M1 TaxID=944289 RepID=A0A0D0CYY5_9AGAR|nr:hypothetical protein GYMLUDRAFT_571067 [Collybiopsis luxurians FD-317 M1]